jgi:hypothetical protein
MTKMRVVDAGELTIARLISTLLSPFGLSDLLGRNAVACLVLARQALMPDFFKQLIANVYTIDGTLREHVEFIVFHGEPSTVSLQVDGAEYRYRTNGIAFSGNLGASAAYGSRRRVRFDDARANELRWDGTSHTAQATARTTEAAVTALKEHFGLSEADLPCLVFVDAGNTRSVPLVVPLSSDDPVRGLYTDILRPLSDAFAKFETYWESAVALEENQTRASSAQFTKEYHERLLQEAHERFAKAETDLGNLANDASGRREQIEALEIERDHLRNLKSGYRLARTLEERLALVPPSHPKSAIIQSCLAEIALLQARIGSATDASEALVMEKQIEKQTNRAFSLVGKTRSADEHRLDEIAKSFKFLGAPRCDLQAAKEEAINAIAGNEKQALIWAERLAERQAYLEREARKTEDAAIILREKGYSEQLLGVTRYGARALVEHMLATGQLGARRKSDFVDETVRVLLLTSAPTDQTRLDLEDEIRAIEEQVRGARFRDNIRLLTGLAARPDDLVRLLSQHKPQVVHFSGHGCPDGIVLRRDNGEALVARGVALERLFRNRGVKLIVLNSCYSEAQAEAIAATGAIVLGTTDAVYDEAAKRFSAAFYRAIASGMSVKDAFRDGGTAVDLYDFPDVYKIIGNADVVLLADRSERR